MTNKFFTYGTLMTGCSNHGVIPMNSIDNIESATIENMDLYSYVTGSFPCMINGNNKVIGEVITIKDEYFNQALKRLDRLEGYYEDSPKDENFYNREIKEVTLNDGTKIEAYVYLFNMEGEESLDEYIGTGDWKEWRTNK